MRVAHLLRGILLVALAVTVSLSAPGCGGGGGGGDDRPRVAVVHAVPSPSYVADVVGKLVAFDVFRSVTAIDASTGTPTLAELEGYDALLLVSDTTFADPETLGDHLAAYSDGGGGVVDAMFDTAWYGWPGGQFITGAWASLNYHPIQSPGQVSADGPIGWASVVPLHPILTDVIYFGGGTQSYRPGVTTVTTGTTLVATWATGEPLVATRTTLVGTRVVGLGFYPVTSDVNSGFVDATSDAMLIVANALRWAAGDL